MIRLVQQPRDLFISEPIDHTDLNTGTGSALLTFTHNKGKQAKFFAPQFILTTHYNLGQRNWTRVPTYNYYAGYSGFDFAQAVADSSTNQISIYIYSLLTGQQALKVRMYAEF